MFKGIIWLSVGALAALGAAALVPVGGHAESVSQQIAVGPNLAEFPGGPPDQALNLVFIHHSVGGQLLADAGPNQRLADSIHVTHENGGGLRTLLKNANYVVHEASYGSKIGDKTDLYDWPAKFRSRMDRILKTRFNDETLSDNQLNQVVVFKSCYPNNRFESEGTSPGNPAGPELTVANAQAALASVLDVTRQHQDVLFVYMTAPPNAPGYAPERLGRLALRRLLGKPSTADVLAGRARLAREFNNWVVAPGGWLKGYPLQNVVAFDYYGMLTDMGASNLSRYPSGGDQDSHPNSEGQKKAAEAFVPFLNRAVRRAGLAR